MAPTSPRLPSPPPQAEIQLGPKSPSMGAQRQAQQMEQTALDANAKRRIHPGTKSTDMAAGPPLVPLNELDSAFQLQEHLAALHYYHTASNTSPMTRETSRLLAQPPAGTDRTLWLYELCRFLVSQCNTLIVGFLFDGPPCSAATCPEMRASEWQFLCAVHDQPKSCCAIDYCCHTLDWAANVVTNPKIFPSRFVVAADAHDRNAALKNLVNVFRRLHRVFAHAWFQHRRVFWSVETQTGLYVFFKTVCDVYDLLPAENYKLPPEAEGLESMPVEEAADSAQKQVHSQTRLQEPGFAPTAIAKPPARTAKNSADDENFGGIGRTNTRRHIRSSPSTGSSVTTVMEADEQDEESGRLANRTKGPHMSSPPETVPEEHEQESDAETEVGMDISVIVEQAMVEQPPNRPSSVIPIQTSSPLEEVASGTQTDTENQDKPEVKPVFEEKPVKEEKDTFAESLERELGADADETVLAPSQEDEKEEILPEKEHLDSLGHDGARDSLKASSAEEESEGSSATAEIIADNKDGEAAGENGLVTVTSEEANEAPKMSE